MDHAATSPLHPNALEVMLPYFKENFGNPSSIHQFGRRARQAMDEARRDIAKTVGASPDEIIFTSGGTEADNLAIFGYVQRNKDKGKHIITTKIEHHAVLHTCEELEKKGYDITYLPVNEEGRVSLPTLKANIRKDTILVSVMFGNNEVGTLQPIQEIGEYLREANIAFHTDAVQAYGMVDIDLNKLPVDFLSVSAHKISGPKGIGFLYARKGVPFQPYIFGGEQEKKRRAGTENVASIVGFAVAAKIAKEEMIAKRERYFSFRKKMSIIFEEEEIPFIINGANESVLPHIFNVSFPGVSVEALLVSLDLAGVAASSGSACTAGTLTTSHVLNAMLEDEERIRSAVRFSFGLGNTMEEIETVARKTVEAVKRIANI